MRDGARLQAVIDLLERIGEGRVPMDNIIRDYMAGRRYIGSKDRRAIVDMTYDVVRHYARLTWWIERLGLPDAPRSYLLVYLRKEKLSVYDIDIRFCAEKYCPAHLDEKEREALENLETVYETGLLMHDDMPPAAQVECPAGMEENLRDLFGADFEKELAAMIEPAALDLRVNTLKVARDDARRSLDKDGVRTELTPYSPTGLRAFDKPYLSKTKAFHNGLIDIQDEGSQLIAQVCEAEPGMRVLDYCAGSGGKTLALAARMEGKGILYACDNSSARLEKGRRRYRKADVHNVEVRSLEEEKNRKWLRRQKETMDIVLVDAPCSSSGTWRRNPDYRWNNYGPEMEKLLGIQKEILERVADKVKPGGSLVYATCSLFRAENEDQINSFLENHPDFHALDLEKYWASKPPELSFDGPFLRTTPARHNTDSFFCARLIKKAS